MTLLIALMLRMGKADMSDSELALFMNLIVALNVFILLLVFLVLCWTWYELCLAAQDLKEAIAEGLAEALADDDDDGIANVLDVDYLKEKGYDVQANLTKRQIMAQ